MDRTTLAQSIVLLVGLGVVPPLLPGHRTPGEASHPLGVGGVHELVRANAFLARKDMRVRRGVTRFRGILGVARMGQLLDLAERVRRESPPGRPARIWARGMYRNAAWMIAYEVYPHRVLARWLPDGVAARDAPPDDVDWVLTLGDEGYALEPRR